MPVPAQLSRYAPHYREIWKKAAEERTDIWYDYGPDRAGAKRHQMYLQGWRAAARRAAEAGELDEQDQVLLVKIEEKIVKVLQERGGWVLRIQQNTYPPGVEELVRRAEQEKINAIVMAAQAAAEAALSRPKAEVSPRALSYGAKVEGQVKRKGHEWFELPEVELSEQVRRSGRVQGVKLRQLDAGFRPDSYFIIIDDDGHRLSGPHEPLAVEPPSA